MKINQRFNFKNVASKSLPFMFAAAMLGTTLTSCEKDDEEETVMSAPTISNLEVGHENNKEAHIGHDLHVEADIVAEGKIDVIEVELHAEDGGTDEIHVVFTEFAGLKNTNFHEHVEIPDTVAAGEYHFHLMVKDQQGKSTEVDADVMIEEGDGHTH